MGIIKKIISESVIETMYDSSNILASKYDTANKNLIITFKNGGRYQYPDVSYTDYYNLDNADSQGVVFNSSIRKNYPTFHKLDSIDVEEYIKDMNAKGLNDEEMKLIQLMTEFVGKHANADKMDMGLLFTVEGAIKVLTGK